MNKVTYDIAKWFNISLEKAKEVQYVLDCGGIDYSEISNRALKREAKEALLTLSQYKIMDLDNQELYDGGWYTQEYQQWYEEVGFIDDVNIELRLLKGNILWDQICT